MVLLMAASARGKALGLAVGEEVYKEEGPGCYNSNTHYYHSLRRITVWMRSIHCPWLASFLKYGGSVPYQGQLVGVLRERKANSEEDFPGVLARDTDIIIGGIYK